MDYTKTLLWKTSLANTDYENETIREELIKNYDKARSNASYILSRIRIDFPSLTVHDIKHVDGLWQVGSVIVGDSYSINPLEGFVLGCSFLMHDAVLSYDAIGGKDKLRDTVEWKDFYSDLKKDNLLSEDEKKYETDFKTIRFLHAKYAEDLYNKLFARDDESKFYIIEDKSLREHLGSVICKIAASHHWDIDKLEKMDIQLPAPAEYPREWNINPLKLACILRCADAGHIDSGRAPDYLLHLLNVNGVSKNHWIAQNRLSQIDYDRRNEEKIVIKSNIKFKEDDFAAWNVAYDAVCVLDHEIKISNELLKKNNITEFKVKGVSGAESQEALSKYIKTDGWIPCNAHVHISDVKKLIKNFGGEKLYGDKHRLEIILRELIQNARDAIVARRRVQSGFEGKISILIEKTDNKTIFSVIDNGVGMSLLTIKDYLLNFGTSFWTSDLLKKEYPGLNSSGYESVGCFGIGFYSVFMLANNVCVETRKYDEGLNDTLVVKFPDGLSLRPIIVNKRSNSTEFSTIVKFSIDNKKYQWNKQMKIETSIYGEESFFVPYTEVLARIVAMLDVDVFYSDDTIENRCIHTNIDKLELGTSKIAKWLKDITFANYRNKSIYKDYIDNNYKRLRIIKCNNKSYGLAALNTLWNGGTNYFNINTIGGLESITSSNTNDDFLGCVICQPETARRDGNLASEYKIEWAKEQYNILINEGLSDTDKLLLPYIIGEYNIDMTNEMLLRVVNYEKNIYTTKLKELLLFLKDSKNTLLLPLSNFSIEDRLENNLDYERTFKIMSKNEILYVVEKNSNFLSIEEFDGKFPINIMKCIMIIGEKNNLKIKKNIVDNKAISLLGYNLKALIISVQ